MYKIKILCLTYGKLDKLTKRAISRILDSSIEISTLDGISENITNIIEDKIREGIEVIIAGGSNAYFSKGYFNVPVVELTVSSYDYIEAVYNAKKIGKKIGIAIFSKDNKYNFSKISEILNTDIKIISYDDPNELETEILSADVDVVIGAAHADEIACKLGIKSILIYPSEDTIIEAIYEARKLAKEMYREKERNELTQALIQFSPNAIIVINNLGTIIEFNIEAEKLLGINKTKAKGSQIKDIIPESKLEEALIDGFDRKVELKKINNRIFLDKQIQILDNNSIMCSLSILTEASEMKEAEYNYQIENEKNNFNKGFNARAKFENIIGSSKEIKKVIDEAKIYSQSDASVLILGNTGTGKELFAQSIHNYSARSGEPFIAINCAALPENLLESELFGYEEGAFTGSKKGGKMGIFELGNGGTIFLDEVGEISIPLQARLLRVLQEKEIMRVGGQCIHKVNVRIISATNKDLYKIGEKEFRRDLLYRINVLELNIPDLCMRNEDITELFFYFFYQRIDLTRHNMMIPADVLLILKKYSWPGNIRELQNVCERFCLFIKILNRIDEKILKKTIIQAIGEDKLLYDIMKQKGYESILDVSDSAKRKNMIEEFKELFPYSNQQLASKLGVSRTSLWRMKK